MAQHPFITGRWLQANHQQENENWHIARNQQNEVTSFGYVPNNQIKSIFLGTFPIYEISEGENQGNLEFFYGSCENKFWPTLNNLFQQPINTVQNRIELLDNIEIGISDILLEIERIQPMLSKDKNLQEVKYKDILELIEKFPTIKNIFITSGGKNAIPNLNANNKSTGTWLKDSISHFNPTGFNNVGYVKVITVNGIKFNLIYLCSPSNNANVAIQGILNNNHNFGLQNLDINLFRQYQWKYFIDIYHLGVIPDIPNQLVEFFEN